MSKMFKFFTLIVISLLYCIDLLTMNKNGNGIISKKIIGFILGVIAYCIKYISTYLKIDLSKIRKNILKYSCYLDNHNSCTKLGFDSKNKNIRYKYLKKSYDIEQNDRHSINLYYYYIEQENDIKKANEYLNKIKSKDKKNLINFNSIIMNYELKKFQEYFKLENKYKNFINIEQKIIYLFIIVINGLLNEINENKLEYKKYYDIFVENVYEENNYIMIRYKNRTYEITIFKIILARIYFYGLSSKGIDYEKAKRIINYVDLNMYNWNNKFWDDEYNKIKNRPNIENFTVKKK